MLLLLFSRSETKDYIHWSRMHNKVWSYLEITPKKNETTVFYTGIDSINHLNHLRNRKLFYCVSLEFWNIYTSGRLRE